MNKSKASALLKKHQENTLSETERNQLEAWYLNQISNSTRQLSEEELEDSVKSLRFKLPVKQEPKVIKIGKRVAAAAIITLFLGTGILYYTQTKESKIQLTEKAQDIVPGGNKAILTLSNGEKIILNTTSAQNANDTLAKEGKNKDIIIKMPSNGVVAYNKNSESTSTQKHEIIFNTLSTPTGGQYSVILADGTKVYLNAESSIKYPTEFVRNQREVELEGEAYFEVAKNKNCPFVVTSNHQTITVLGTHFNVHAYADESNVKTTLVEGSVLVSFKNQKTILKPGEQAETQSQSNTIRVRSVDTEFAVAWKEGRFKFDNANLKSIMKQLQRWYGITVEYRGVIPDTRFFGGTFMNKNLSEVLKVLELSNIEFEVEGKKIIVHSLH